MKLTLHRNAGFTLVEIMVAVAIIGMLVTIAIPSYFKNRELAQQNTCKSNLRVIDTAKQLWAIETGQGPSDVPDDDDLIGVGLYIRRKPICPQDGEYTYWEISEFPECDKPGHVLNIDDDRNGASVGDRNWQLIYKTYQVTSRGFIRKPLFLFANITSLKLFAPSSSRRTTGR